MGKIYAGKITNKNGLCYDLNNRESFCCRCKQQILLIEIGDSIYKPSNTFDMYIYKKANPDSVVFVECNFDCNIYKEDE
jgi:hypothetical protein